MKRVVRLSAIALILLLSLLLTIGASADYVIKSGNTTRVVSAVPKEETESQWADIEYLTPDFTAGKEVSFRYTIHDPSNTIFTGEEEVWCEIRYFTEIDYLQYLKNPCDYMCYGLKSFRVTDYSDVVKFKIPDCAHAIQVFIGLGDEYGMFLMSGENNGKVIPVEPIKGITTNCGDLVLYPGQSYSVVAFLSGNLTAKFTFSSSNTGVAPVYNSDNGDYGYVDAKRPGSAVITIKGPGKSKCKLKVTVKPLPAARLNKKSLQLKVGQVFQLSPKVKLDAKASLGTDVTWSYASSAKKIVSVDKKTGLITAKKKGNAVITVTGRLDSAPERKVIVTATCKVKVK